MARDCAATPVLSEYKLVGGGAVKGNPASRPGPRPLLMWRGLMDSMLDTITYDDLVSISKRA